MMWMPAWTIRIVWPGIDPSSGSWPSTASHARLSAPTANGLRSASQREPSAVTPPAATYAAGSPNSAPEPSRTSTTSPSRMSASQAASSSGPTAAQGATSSSTPRRTIGATVSMPSSVKPVGVCTCGVASTPPCMTPS